jgi:5-methyltetrahydrofolate corrinoid/iron sulfur protein methyltransferase
MSYAHNTPTPLTIIGQDMHIMNPALSSAVDQQDACRLAEMAEKQVKAGAHALDLNLGPARKNKSLISWAAAAIQETVQVPLFISSHVLSQPETLKMHRGTATINSVTADPALLVAAMETAKEYGTRLVVLLVRPGLTPFTVDERLQLAMDVLETAALIGFPLTELYLDPLFHLRPDPMTWQLSRGVPDIDSVLETIEMLPQLTGEKVQTLVALSSASQFLPAAERPGLHQRLLPMLAAAGLDAVILNCHDSRLMEIARNPNTAVVDTPYSPVQPQEEMSTATLHW